jgi:molybdenum cofactor cytidylyltransferase
MRSIGAIILAAGESSRLGRPKQLLTFRGETLVGRAVRAAVESGCDPVVVVTGKLDEAIRDALRSSSALVVTNPGWQRGLGTSIHRGMQEIADSVDSLVILASDQPFVDASVIRALISAQEESARPIAACKYANTLGVPALFARSCFETLLALPAAAGAKSLLASRAEELVAIEFELGAVDIDTPEDLGRLKDRLSA